MFLVHLLAELEILPKYQEKMNWTIQKGISNLDKKEFNQSIFNRPGII